MSTSPSGDDEIIDVRDVIERVEQLRQSIANDPFRGFDRDPSDVESERTELARLESLLDDIKGMGGNEQWQGDWYPITLIRDDHFEDYARELAEDIGAIPTDYSWPASHIDWEAAADALLVDYGSVEFDGVTFWTR